MIPKLSVCFFENSVPKGFTDWTKLWLQKDDTTSQKVQYLLSNNELEEALWIYDSILFSLESTFPWKYVWNDRIH